METIYKLALPREVQSLILTYTSTTCADIIIDFWKKNPENKRRKFQYKPYRHYEHDGPGYDEYEDAFSKRYPTKIFGVELADIGKQDNPQTYNPTWREKKLETDTLNGGLIYKWKIGYHLSSVDHHYKKQFKKITIKQLRETQRQNGIKGGRSAKEVWATLMKL